MREFGPFVAEGVSLKRGKPGAFCVEASAGTGKTYSITGLVLRLVCEENLPLDEILVVTFTRAAAAELRGRIGERLATAQADLERAAHALDQWPDAWAAFLQGDASALKAAGEEVFKDDFVSRWVLAASEDGDAQELATNIDRWLKRIRRARQRVDAATFTTIHSFCQRMLEWHAFESDQPLGITFVEDEVRLRQEIANDLWGEVVEGLPAEVMRFASLDSSSFYAGVELALSRRSALLARWDADAARSPAGPGNEDLTLDHASTTLQLVFRQCAESVTGALSSMRRIFVERRDELCAWVRDVVGHAKKGNWRDAFSELQCLNTNSLADDLETFLLPRLQRAAQADMLVEPFWVEATRYLGSDLLRGGLQEQGAKKKARTEELLAHPLRSELAGILSSSLSVGALPSRLLVAACHEARRRYAARLAARSEVTFDDLITRLADRVKAEAAGGGDPALTRAVRTRYRAALIDEFQDTDDAQWTLFDKVFLESEDHRLFLIGDPKQAIYRFRGADIHTYLRARTRVHQVARRRLAAHGASEEELQRAGLYTMTRNFRSDAALLVALNRFMGGLHAEGTDPQGEMPSLADPQAFARAVTWSGQPGAAVSGFFDRRDDPSGTGIDYILVDWNKPSARKDEDCVLVEAPGSGLRVEGAPASPPTLPWTAQPLVFRPVALPLPEEEQPQEGASQLGNNEACKRQLSQVVAADVRRLLESGTRIALKSDADAPAERAVSPGDIAVLVHSWKMGHAIASRLRSHGIPAVIMAGEVVWKCDEAEDLAVLLAGLLNLRNRGSVVAALSTALLSVAPTHLRMFTGEASELPERWLDVLGQLSQTWQQQGLLRLVSELLELRVDPISGLPAGSGPRDQRAASSAPTRREALLQAADGERRLTNLHQLTELLHAECSGLFLGPQGQLDTLRARMVDERKDSSSPDDPRKQRLDTDDQAVRVTTLYGSKGLEYPIVFLPSFDNRSLHRSKLDAPVVVPEALPATADQVDGRRDLAAPLDTSRRSILYATKTLLDVAAGEVPPPNERDEHESEEESRRLLYVGLTRAKHQVVLYARDWTDRKVVTSADGLADPKSAGGSTALGRLLGATPRVAALVNSPDALRAFGETGGTLRGDNDRTVLIGDVCLALGDVVNPVGETIFAVPRRAEDLPARAREPWRSRGQSAADSGPELDPVPTLLRTRFHAVDYRQGSFSALATGAAHGAQGPGTAAAPAGTEDQDAADRAGRLALSAEGLDEVMRDRAGMDEPGMDEELSEDSGTSEGPDERPDLLFETTRLVGRDFGTAVHELLEKADFDAPRDPADPVAHSRGAGQSLEEATAGVVRRFGFQLSPAALQGLASDVHVFLHAPLGGVLEGACLADVPRARRIDELEFLLPVPEHLSREGLVAAFRAGPPPGEGTSWAQAPGAWEAWLDEVGRLSFATFHGFLTGFVDLVFATEEDKARVHLLDYKTNKLHQREMSAQAAAASYDQPALVRAMIESRYVLQYHLYQVALLRLLRSRHGASFDWDQHVGGAWYPFLRGVQDVSAAPVKGSALRRGIFYDRAPRERIEALDALFGSPGSSVTARRRARMGVPSTTPHTHQLSGGLP